jgi:hypothetical protein
MKFSGSRRFAKPPGRCMQTDESAVQKNACVEKSEINAGYYGKCCTFAE